MVKAVIMAVFIGCLAEIRVEVVQTRTWENAHNLLDSITANNIQSRQKYREILQHDVVQEQQFHNLFDCMVKNDHQQSDMNRETLVQETVRKRQISYSAVQGKLQSARRMKAYVSQENSRRRRDNTDENVVVPKPNAENNQHVSIKTASSVSLQGSTKTTSPVPNNFEDIIVHSHEIDIEMKDFKKANTIGEMQLGMRLLIRAKLEAQKKLKMLENEKQKQLRMLEKENNILKINLTAALEDAGFSEFLLHIRTKSEVFEEQMMVHTGFYGDPQFKKTEYETLVWKRLECRDSPKAGEIVQLPQELANGTHYRKFILILHFADERVSMQLKLLKDLLGRTREAYHRYAMAHQILYSIWSKDPHGKLLNLKYVTRDKLDYYISLLSDELQWGVQVFVLSELTGGIV